MRALYEGLFTVRCEPLYSTYQTQQARGPQLCSGSGRYQLGRTIPNTGGLDKVLDWTPFSGGKPRTVIVCANDGVGVCDGDKATWGVDGNRGRTVMAMSLL